MQDIYHILEQGTNCTVYDVLHREFYSVPKTTGIVLNEYFNQNNTIDSIVALTGVSIEEVNNIINEYTVSLDELQRRNQVTGKELPGWDVSFHISHVCNLSCSYCYVHGNYGKSVLMSEKTLEASLRYLDKIVGNIKGIGFYGGEPTLNIPALKKTIAYFKESVTRNCRDAEPKYTIVTNGTNISDDMAEYIASNRISAVVSIDGPEAVHDVNRPRLDGTGSYNSVGQAIKALTAKGVEISFSAVYSPEHIKQGLSEEDIVMHLKNSFGLEIGAVTPAFSVFSYKDILSYDCESTMDYIDKHIDGIPATRNWIDVHLRRLLLGEQILSTCPGGIECFAIDPEGKIFPCQSFVGRKEFQIGSVYDHVPFPVTEMYKHVVDKIQSSTNIARNKKCSLCWARNLCNYCPVTTLTYFGELYPSEDYCQQRRECLERVIGKMCSIFSDSKKKASFICHYQSRMLRKAGNYESDEGFK